MGYVQTREHEAEHCYVPFTRDQLNEMSCALRRLSRIDRHYNDDRTADYLELLADKIEEVEGLAHPRRIHFQLCPMQVS